MTELLTARQMKALERAAIESGEVTGLELMERAGRGVVEAVFEKWPDLVQAPHRAMVLCGPGNNGGDGFVVARLLREWGWEVEAFLFGDAEKLPPDARANYERWETWGKTHPFSAFRRNTQCDLLVDALFGTGLTRPVGGDLGDLLARLNERSGNDGAPRVVAVDVPSGLCADSGRVLGACLKADLAVSFHSLKVGHVIGAGPSRCDALAVRDIGLTHAKAPGVCQLAQPSVDLLKKTTGSHKYAHGHALVLSGGPGRTGAARLAARGALRIGTGLVTLGVPGAAQLEAASQVTEVMLRRAGTSDELAATLEDERLNALCLGPGLGIERARDLAGVALADGGKTRSCVLDADALTGFAAEPEALFTMLNEACVLTPHAGEFRRLFPDIAEKLDARATHGPAYSKVDATREAAARAGCVVLFKGADTVIAAPDGRCRINAAHFDRAAPWLATAGSGDVLAGFITGLLARGIAPFLAAETAAWLHVECARSFGPGLIAGDLPEELPRVFKALGL